MLTSHEEGMRHRMPCHSKTSCPVGHLRGLYSSQELSLPTATPDVIIHVLTTATDEQVTPKLSSLKQPFLTILVIRNLGNAQPESSSLGSLTWLLSDAGWGCRRIKAWWGWTFKMVHARGWQLMPAATWDQLNTYTWPLQHEGLSVVRLMWQMSFPREPWGNLMAFGEPASEAVSHHFTAFSWLR